MSKLSLERSYSGNKDFSWMNDGSGQDLLSEEVAYSPLNSQLANNRLGSLDEAQLRCSC